MPELRVVPWPDESFPHPGVLPYRQRRSAASTRPRARTMVDGRTRPGGEARPGTSMTKWSLFQLIPVVTFLAPLASNFEGLKDR